MPSTPIDQAPAGPALDAAVAEVQGKQVKWMEGAIEQSAWPAYLAGVMSSRDTGWREEEDWRGVPEYSTDIAAAWELVVAEQMAIIPLDNGMWVAPSDVAMTNYWKGADGKLSLSYYELHLGHSSLADTAPLAITRAYLKAKGVEEVKID